MLYLNYNKVHVYNYNSNLSLIFTKSSYCIFFSKNDMVINPCKSLFYFLEMIFISCKKKCKVLVLI